MWCLCLSYWGLFVERVLQVSCTGKVNGLRVLCEVSLISIPPNLFQISVPPDLFHISIFPDLVKLVGLLQGRVLVPEEVELSLDGSLLLNDLLYLAGTGLPYDFDLCLEGKKTPLVLCLHLLQQLLFFGQLHIQSLIFLSKLLYL